MFCFVLFIYLFIYFDDEGHNEPLNVVVLPPVLSVVNKLAVLDQSRGFNLLEKFHNKFSCHGTVSTLCTGLIGWTLKTSHLYHVSSYDIVHCDLIPLWTRWTVSYVRKEVMLLRISSKMRLKCTQISQMAEKYAHQLKTNIGMQVYMLWHMSILNMGYGLVRGALPLVCIHHAYVNKPAFLHRFINHRMPAPPFHIKFTWVNDLYFWFFNQNFSGEFPNFWKKILHRSN